MSNTIRASRIYKLLCLEPSQLHLPLMMILSLIMQSPQPKHHTSNSNSKESFQNEKAKDSCIYRMVSYHRIHLSIIFVTIVSSIHEAYGRKTNKSKVWIEDPKKPSLVLERDIFLVSTEPSSMPSTQPSVEPSYRPTREASLAPSLEPTSNPSQIPSSKPSLEPSSIPTRMASTEPSLQPSSYPTKRPSLQPSSYPSLLPSMKPIFIPSSSPSSMPSTRPTPYPSNVPSIPPLTSSPTQFYLPGNLPALDDPHSISYFNYNPYDENFGPGKAMEVVYNHNETSQEIQNVYESRNETTWILQNITNSTTNHTSWVNTTFVETIMTKIQKTKNITITKSYEYKNFEDNAWSTVRNSREYEYWKDFNMNRTLGNRCASTPKRTQSPIDLCETHVNTECHEHHQIRNRVSFNSMFQNHRTMYQLKNPFAFVISNTKGGEFNLDDAEMELQILPSKLRIKYSRENSQLDEDNGLIPPHSDFPLNWNGYISAVHIDIKIPSEHTFCGKRYAGEYQIFFYHPKRKQPIVQSVLIEIHPKDRPHLHFQKVLNEWQAIFDWKHLECRDRRRRLKRDDEGKVGIDKGPLSSNEQEYEDRYDDESFQRMLKKARDRVQNPVFDVEYESISPSFQTRKNSTNRSNSTSTNHFNGTSVNATNCDNDFNNTFIVDDRNVTCCDHFKEDMSISCNQTSVFEKCPSICSNLTHIHNYTIPSDYQSQSPSSSPSNKPRPRWNPFWPRIINSIHFYGYDGSLTEPPCSEWVSWRVLDTPMQISYDQWDQMRNILFNQVDEESCRRSSVHWKGSVARPIQSLNERPLWKCTERDYVSDVEKLAAKALKEKAKANKSPIHA